MFLVENLLKYEENHFCTLLSQRQSCEFPYRFSTVHTHLCVWFLLVSCILSLYHFFQS